jgi:PBSX family phage terminase large subunit
MEKTITLHKYQDEAIFAENKFVAAIAGVQSGKTLGGAVWANIKVNKLETDGLIVANDYKMLDQSTLRTLFNLNPKLQKFYKQQRGIIEFPNKKRIYIRSAERPESIEGFKVGWAWGDEAGKWGVDAWINLQARVAMEQGQTFLTTTPDTMNWLYYDFYDRYLKGDKDFKVVQWKSIDNPYFPKEEYERAKRTMTPLNFRRRYEGTFERMEGLVYALDSSHILEPFKINKKDCIAGVDFGWTNPSAVIVVMIDNDGVFHIVDEHYRENQTTDELIEVCKNLRDKYGITKFYPDPAEPDRIEEMRRSGLNVREVKKDVLAGISEVQSLLLQHKIKVFKNCKYTIEEFNKYHFESAEESKNQKEKPLPFFDHLMDALRYALTTYSYTPQRPKGYNYKPLNVLTGY